MALPHTSPAVSARPPIAGRDRRRVRALAAVAAAAAGVAALAGSPARAADAFWDTNGITPGAGSPANGNWGVNAFWGNAAGTAVPIAWVPGDTAFFSAGADALDPATVTLTSTQIAGGLHVQEGFVSLTGSGAVSLGAGAASVANGATLSIDSVLRVGATAGSVLTLNGGTLRNTVTGAASATFWDADSNIQIGTSAGTTTGTVDTVNIINLYRGTVLGEGGAVDAGGAGTLVKTGAGEFRYEGPTTANSTFAKLVVNQGVFRIGSGVAGSTEAGFGAVPVTAGALADAITLNGGAIGASLNLATHAKRGITLGAGGGTFLTTGGSLTINGPISGAGTLKTDTGTAGLVINSPDLATTFTGGFEANGKITLNQSMNAAGFSGAATGAITIAAGKTLSVGSDNSHTTYSGGLAGPGAFAKTGTGVLTLDGATEFANTGGFAIHGGVVRYSSLGILGPATVLDIGAAGTLDLNGVAETIGNLTGSGQVVNFGANRTLGVGGGTTTQTWSGVISGNVNLSKINAGSTLVVAAAQTYTGTTNIGIGGRLFIGADNALPVATTLNLNAATFDLANPDGQPFNQQVAAFANLAAAGATPVVTNSASGEANRRTFTVSGTALSTLANAASVASIQGNLTLAKGGAGTFNLAGSTNTFTGGIVITGGTLAADGDANLGAVPGASDSDNITLNGGTLRFGASFDPHANRGITLGAAGGTINTNGFDATVAAPITGSGAFTKSGGGTLRLPQNLVTAGTARVSGGALQLPANGGRVVKAGTVSVDAGAQLDLVDNKLIVTDGALGTVGNTATGAYSGVTALVQIGRNGGAWNGSGIMTSQTRADTGLTTLAIAPASATPYGALGAFAGQSVAPDDVLVMYTYGGDADLSGSLDSDDYFAIDSNFNMSGKVFGFHVGDFDYNGAIDSDDYFIIDSNFNNQILGDFPGVTSFQETAVTAVPEPSAACVFAFTAAVALRRRRRHRRPATGDNAASM